MTWPTRLSALGPKTKVALGGLVALVVLVALFDWNWFRPALERYLTHTSQRTVRLADLRLSLNARLQPTVRLRGVNIQNAPWAEAQQPFAVAGEARFTFGWKSLFEDVHVITHMVLIDADIDLERQADGVRNWRLTKPDDRGPARIKVLALEVQRTRLRVVHHGVGLSVQAASTPLPLAEGPLTQRITFSGQLKGAPFEGEALAEPVLSLQGTGQLFALRGQAHSGSTRLWLDGRVADLLKLGGLDARLQLSGASLSELKPFFPLLPWPASKPYRADARVTRHEDAITAQDLHATLGSSDVAGKFAYDKPGERATLNASLRSERIALGDLPLPHPANGTGGTQRVLPQTTLALAPLRDTDARVEWRVKALHSVHDLSARATLDQGLLHVAVEEARWAEGRLSGQFTLDNRQATPAVQLAVQVRGLRLEKLWPEMPRPVSVEGPLQADLKLGGQGPSVASWAGSANGQLRLAMSSGSLSPRLDAKLGLNAGKLLRSFIVGDRPVPIRCAAALIDFDKGTGTSRQLVLDTAQTRIEGTGSLHLHDESWALLLTPQAHQPALFALHSSVLAKGNFRGFSYGLDGSKQANKAASGACNSACAAATSPGCG